MFQIAQKPCGFRAVLLFRALPEASRRSGSKYQPAVGFRAAVDASLVDFNPLDEFPNIRILVDNGKETIHMNGFLPALLNLPLQLLRFGSQFFLLQVKSLWENVLDVLSPKEPVQKKMAEYYEGKSTNGLEIFPFQPLALRFERIDRKTFTEVLYPKGIYEIIDYFIRECIKWELPFRVCKNCGKYFPLTGHINTEYCDRSFDSVGRTCKEIGALRVWEKKKAENPAFKAYSKAYKKRFAWIKYGKITQEAFYEWSEQARKMREQCANGKISLDEFKEWLE